MPERAQDPSPLEMAREIRDALSSLRSPLPAALYRAQEQAAQLVSALEREEGERDDLDTKLRALIRSGLWIQAIKRHREVTGSDLRMAKDYVDRLRMEEARTPERPRGAGEEM